MIEIYCDNCDAYQPLEQGEWTRDGEHEFQDQPCGACHFVIATERRKSPSRTDSVIMYAAIALFLALEIMLAYSNRVLT